MSDFNDGLAVGMAIGRKKSSGGTQKHDSIFHDILENSEELCSVDIDDNFKMTINFLFTDRIDIYNVQIAKSDTNNSYACEGEGKGYDQRFLWNNPRANIFAIFWRENIPLYANFIATEVVTNGYDDVRINDTPGDNLHSKIYIYPWHICSYKKQSAKISTEMPDPSKIWSFDMQEHGVKTFNPSVYWGGTVNFTCVTKYYEPYFPNDLDTPPIIHFDHEVDVAKTIGIYPFYSYPTPYGTFSDLTVDEILKSWDEIANAVCMAYGGSACYKHERPILLLPSE